MSGIGRQIEAVGGARPVVFSHCSFIAPPSVSDGLYRAPTVKMLKSGFFEHGILLSEE